MNNGQLLLTRPQYLGVAGPLVLHLGCMLLQQSLVQNVLPVHYQLVRLLQQLVELQINKLAYFLTFFPSQYVSYLLEQRGEALYLLVQCDALLGPQPPVLLQHPGHALDLSIRAQ